MTDTPPLAGAMIWCPFPDENVARSVAGKVLDERLVACANMLGSTLSLFVWQGSQRQAEETGVLFKTDAVLLDRAVQRIAELHPYQAPAVLGWRCEAGAPATLAWLAELRP
ncbi:divalent-cation tolerance protein CutA [Novosphingobium arvoryzae]|uniref:Divalent-cation tolerance protein CutA n=1 Tax=Novosphingobium arvoryzae TaxID=1256514 RepID=A0A918R525_9SPHN|nr:divalent-cation tolerance protein CutA [Novosphingobium arvoryzae]GGZ86453.1 divalent-cation tolerance protein CutA [Novosphingobium arvoryzae]